LRYDGLLLSSVSRLETRDTLRLNSTRTHKFKRWVPQPNNTFTGAMSDGAGASGRRNGGRTGGGGGGGGGGVGFKVDHREDLLSWKPGPPPSTPTNCRLNLWVRVLFSRSVSRVSSLETDERSSPSYRKFESHSSRQSVSQPVSQSSQSGT